MICYLCFHRRGNADRAVNPAEIIIGEVQRERGPMILELFGESICQPSEASNLHPHRKVLTLDVRRANLLRIGLS